MMRAIKDFFSGIVVVLAAGITSVMTYMLFDRGFQTEPHRLLAFGEACAGFLLLALALFLWAVIFGAIGERFREMDDDAQKRYLSND